MPDVFILGFTKCATTSMYNQLCDMMLFPTPGAKNLIFISHSLWATGSKDPQITTRSARCLLPTPVNTKACTNLER